MAGSERDEKLYFVRETKSTVDSDGGKHFDSIGVDYDVVTSLAEVSI